MAIEVCEKNAITAGSCVACSSRYGSVLEIHLGSLIIRLCDDCWNLLQAKIKRAQRV